MTHNPESPFPQDEGNPHRPAPKDNPPTSKQPNTSSTQADAVEAALQQAQVDVLKLYVEEQRAQRSAKRLKWLLLTAVVAGTIWSFTGDRRPSIATPSITPYASVVKIEGEIGPGRSVSAEAINSQLERAFNDKNSKGVILLVNSPGGTPVQSSLIHDRIQALKLATGKQVIAVGEDVMASGAYMIATAADQIMVNRSTVTGSIGVISRGFGLTELMKKIGVERRTLTAGESKNAGDPFSTQTEKEREAQLKMLDQVHAHFIDTVKQGRGDKLDVTNKDLFTGAVWTGERAISLGLVDRLGDMALAKKELGAATVQVYQAKQPILSSLIGELSTSVLHQMDTAAIVDNAPSLHYEQR